MNNKEVLSSILKTTQMGQIGIQSVMPYAVRVDLKQALKEQLQEYDSIEREAHAIASSRGWNIDDLNPAIKFMSKSYCLANLMFGDVDSKIAAMMIQGNTRGMIKGLKSEHRATQEDTRVSLLAQKLRDSETANIKQMQRYV